jgi:hypothetical protein
MRGAGWILLAACLLAEVPGAHGQAGETYLQHPTGTYRGRIVDEASGRPIAHALVVIFWEFRNPDDGDKRNVVAARDLLTDAAGEFVVDARAIETRLVARAYPPRILIYTPGHASVPAEFVSPPGARADRVLGPGTAIRLRRLSDPEAEIAAFNAFAASVHRLRFADGDIVLRHTFAVIDEELQRLVEEHKAPPPRGQPR